MMTFIEYLAFYCGVDEEDLTEQELEKYYEEYCNSEYYNGEKGL